MRSSLCDGWEFTENWSEDFLCGRGEAQSVRLPHTCKKLPLHYIDHESYQMLCGYRRGFVLPPSEAGKRVFLQFDGAAHVATVYLNGRVISHHSCGYTGFRVELPRPLLSEAANLLAVRLDSREDPSVPPFGFVVDYLGYGGLYREAWLETRESCFIEDVFVSTPSLKSAYIRLRLNGSPAGARLKLLIRDGDGRIVWEKLFPADSGNFSAHVPSAEAWSPDSPRLYTCVACLLDGEGHVTDSHEDIFGFRTARFEADGFYLNGKKLFLRGLNRHQSYPYIGYAAPESLQREDARLLQEELGCNAVRTSHYPQSRYFLDECDRRGLLVFTELPGWQHIGDEAWKEQACQNLREMIIQNRNHPCIVLWGVRINESLDDDDFYTRTNAIAHELDPSRQTSGVRYLEKSSLLEDVYAYNDFSHTGNNPGAKSRRDVSPDESKALLISECNGHMFPTKSFDSWAHRQEQALRHARVQDAACGSGEHSGCFGWCMFDYPTHKDFGSGDRICYHGVMDAFRNPKLASALYASQSEFAPVLEVGSSMDIGDYPAGQLGKVYVFSNAEQVALYKNGNFVTMLEKSELSHLPHPPFVVTDTIGKLLETQEGFPPAKAALLRDCLLAAAKYGLAGLPAGYKAKLLYCMLRYHMSFDDGVALYGKYVSNWGGEATCWRFEALSGGCKSAELTRSPSCSLHLELKVSHTCLCERQSYDMAAVRVRVLDGNGSIAPYAQLPIEFHLSGDAELEGPEIAVAEGGMCGTYIRSIGKKGTACLTVSAAGTEPITINFAIDREEEE